MVNGNRDTRSAGRGPIQGWCDGRPGVERAGLHPQRQGGRERGLRLRRGGGPRRDLEALAGHSQGTGVTGRKRALCRLRFAPHGIRKRNRCYFTRSAERSCPGPADGSRPRRSHEYSRRRRGAADLALYLAPTTMAHVTPGKRAGGERYPSSVNATLAAVLNIVFCTQNTARAMISWTSSREKPSSAISRKSFGVRSGVLLANRSAQ